MVTVTPKIKRILAERGMTQTELSNLSGVPQAFISRFDKAEIYNFKNIVLLSRALGLTVEGLFDIEEEAE